MNIPAAVKGTGQYVKRAEEVERDSGNPDSHIIAFWCRQMALEKSLGYYEQAGVKEYVTALMDIQEKNKAASGDRAVGKGICENHALLVFDMADSEDRAGKASRGTAKLFYNASSFLDVLDQFDELKGDSEIENKRKYSKFKSKDILDAIKEGRVPMVGNGETENAPGAPSGGSQPVVPSANPANMDVVLPTAPPAAQPARQLHLPPASSGTIGTVFKQIATVFTGSDQIIDQITGQKRAPPTGPQDDRVKDAMELSHFAISSMKYGDIEVAKTRLREALKKLES
jgi:vacuolar protein sorting-associated protein VTA1